MSHLPQLSGREGIAALQQIGSVIVRQRGSHIMLRRESPFAEVVVPNHRELDGAHFGRSFDWRA